MDSTAIVNMPKKITVLCLNQRVGFFLEKSCEDSYEAKGKGRQ